MRKKRQKPATFSAADVKLTQDVKRANQRLRELEKQGMENSPAYRAIERLAYNEDVAIGKTTKGQIKFKTNIRKMSYDERRHLEAQVKRFLEAETSTTKGVKEVKKRAEDAYNEKFGGDYSDWLLLWGTAIAHQYKMMYGSDFTAQVINALHGNMTREQAQQFMENHFGQPMADIMDAMAHTEMEETGDGSFDWEDLFT